VGAHLPIPASFGGTVIIRRYILTIASENQITSKSIEDALDSGMETLPGAAEFNFVLESERLNTSDAGVDPQNTIEENAEWSRLARKAIG